VLALLLLVSLLFTVFGTQDRLRYRFPVPPPIGTLNGMAYMDTAQFGTSMQGPQGEVPLTINLKYDHEAINWLNQHVTGLTTIAELPYEYYRADGMRAASNTGLPMVIGGLHQNEQRAEAYDRLVGDRQGDMNNFFTTSDVQQALTIISKYDIRYIYLGQLEQAKAGEAGMQKFQQMADPKIGILQEVFRSDNPPDVPGTIIYKVSTAKDKDPRTLVGSPVANSGLPGISITPLPTSTPVPLPTPPVNNPELNQLIADVSANPTNPDIRMKLVDWYRQNGYHLEAAEQLAILCKAQPTNVAVCSQLGDEYTAANRPDEALKAWETMRDNSPNNPDAHNKVGIAYFERKRYDDAQKEFEAAVNADKNFVESWFHLGEVYERKGDVENAKKAYQAAIDNSKEPNGWKDSAQERLNRLK
jgi:tetratricopeptide (TPR) repeat protein